MSLTAILVKAQSLSLSGLQHACSVLAIMDWDEEHAVKIDCGPSEACVQKSEDTIRVQAGSQHSVHGHSSGPREERKDEGVSRRGLGHDPAKMRNQTRRIWAGGGCCCGNNACTYDLERVQWGAHPGLRRVVLALVSVMKMETAETYLGKKVNNTLVVEPAYNDPSGRPDLRYERRHLRGALLAIEDGIFGYEPLQETRTLVQTHERHGLDSMCTSAFESPLAEH